ncbi:DUF4269 domain-containing protein [Bacillus sp. H-16]|uniref:DUF4269 domain-containing protein n=1 Tax=Alteribacter salitolerans TaxID=2912333 RepID=UPI0019663FEC|nr:DUF4269 domain-containing protein [Alteribacter salitolerans]MBM7094411.1 DUF4269 domain-containing protein [Alteribacter salitolerans]
MEVSDFAQWENQVKDTFGHLAGFRIKHSSNRDTPFSKANFFYSGFEFELFGQDVPVTRQNAYLHMLVEQALLNENPDMKNEIRKLKANGLRTEAAFCKVLGLSKKDPYTELLNYGKSRGLIR